MISRHVRAESFLFLPILVMFLAFWNQKSTYCTVVSLHMGEGKALWCLSCEIGSMWFLCMVQELLYQLLSLISPGAKLTTMETQFTVTPQFISGSGFNYKAPWRPSRALPPAHEIKRHPCKPSGNPSVIWRCRRFFFHSTSWEAASPQVLAQWRVLGLQNDQ